MTLPPLPPLRYPRPRIPGRSEEERTEESRSEEQTREDRSEEQSASLVVQEERKGGGLVVEERRSGNGLVILTGDRALFAGPSLVPTKEAVSEPLLSPEVAQALQVLGIPGLPGAPGAPGAPGEPGLPAPPPIDDFTYRLAMWQLAVAQSQLLAVIYGEMHDVNLKTALQTEPMGMLGGEEPFTVRRVRVTATLVDTGQVVQGPDVLIPPGFRTIVRMRRHTGSPNGYVSASRSGVLDDSSRSVLGDNDALELAVSNWNKIFFGADTFGTLTSVNFELITERNPRQT